MHQDKAVSRRAFLQGLSGGVAAGALGTPRVLADDHPTASEASPTKPVIFKTLKYHMIKEDRPLADQFKLVRDVGFDGVEMSYNHGYSLEQLIKARDEAGIMIPGLLLLESWDVRLSDPDASVRRKARENLEAAIAQTHQLGGSSVLLIPGKVSDAKNENQQQVWDRSTEQIRQAIPVAAKYGVPIGVENVWNGFNYDPNGSNQQSPDRFVRFIDQFASPWVGMYYDIGNHQKFASPPQWIRALGRRIIKIDVKDWSKEKGLTEIGQGTVDWPAVRQALAAINYHGWASAEVDGGKRDRLAQISQRMDQALGL
jgi:hexulose-6-phosphate isomerase